MAHRRVPKPEVASVVVYNNQDVNGKWIPMRLEIDSWVTLQATTRGAWGRDARRHGEDTNVRAWKAQIKGFRLSVQPVGSRTASKLESILVRHAYLRRQLYLDPAAAFPERWNCNYLSYASFWEDWVHPSSVLDIILVLHHSFGEVTRNGRSHRQLMTNGTFYLRAIYVPPAGVELYGHLEPIPLPNLHDPEWPIPDMHSSEVFRLKIASDFAAAMKPTTECKIAHIQWFLPMHMMADFFAVEKNVCRTTTMYIFDTASLELLQSLMDDGCNEKYVVGQDVTKCVVSEDTIVFRYHVGRQVLYANFQYVRFRAGLNQTWVLLDQVTMSVMVAVCVRFGDMVLPSFEVGEKWPVAHIRNEIGIILSKNVIPEEYDLVVERIGFPNFKVNARNEKITKIRQVLSSGGHIRMVPIS